MVFGILLVDVPHDLTFIFCFAFFFDSGVTMQPRVTLNSLSSCLPLSRGPEVRLGSTTAPSKLEFQIALRSS